MNGLGLYIDMLLCLLLASSSFGAVDLKLDLKTAHNLVITQKGKVYDLEITGADPHVVCEKVNFAASKTDCIRIKYRSADSCLAEVYWLTEVWATNYDQGRVVQFPLDATTKWRVCDIPVGLVAERWTGTVTAVRFDPSVDASKGRVEIASIKLVSKPSRMLATAPARPGECVAEVVTGIDHSTGSRYIQNSRFLVRTKGAGLEFCRLEKDGTPVPLADIDIEVDRSNKTAAFSSKSFPPENLFCRFQDRWRQQILSLFYRSPRGTRGEEAINARVDVTMQPDRAPWFRLSETGRLIISPPKPIVEVFAPGTGVFKPGADGPANVGSSRGRVWLKLQIGQGSPVYVYAYQESGAAPKISAEQVTFDLRRECQLALYSKEPPVTDISGARHSANLHASAPESITLRPGITVVHVRAFEPRGYHNAAIPLEGPAAFSTVISSDYMDVNLPVGVNEVKVEIPPDTQVTSVHDAISDQKLSYTVEGSCVVLKRQPARTVRIKCDRLLDYRVMFNAASIPVDGGHFQEDFSNFYYPQWMMFWDGWIDKTVALDWLDRPMQSRPLPVFLGLHYGNHGPPGIYDTFQKLHPDILQMDNHGNPNKGFGGPPPWMCLVHPTLWSEISAKLDVIFQTAKAKPWYNRIFAFSSTSEPWILADERDPNTVFCYNPEHINWFRRFEKEKWNGDLAAFSSTFGTSFGSWDKVEPPRKVEKSAYWNEWLLSKFEAVIASEEFYRGEIFEHEPGRPNYAHSAIIVIYNQIKNSDTPDIMHIGKDTNPDMFKEGGSLYSNDPAYQALVADSIRAYDTDEASFPECSAPNYGEMYAYLVGATGLFKKNFSFMIPGTGGWGQESKPSGAWPAFSEMTRFVCLDLGDAPKPEIGLLFDPISDNLGHLNAAHKAFFERNIDRCVVTTRMIERGYLSKHPLNALILPGVKLLSEKALSEIATAMAKGLKVVVLGDFAETDYCYQVSPDFTNLRNGILAKVAKADNAAAIAAMFEPRVKVSDPFGLVIYKKSKGITLYNRWSERQIKLELPAEMRSGKIAVVSDTGQVVEVRNPSDEITFPLGAMRAYSVVRCGE